MNNAAKKLDAEIVEQPKTSLEVVKKDEKEVAEVPSLEKRIQKVEDLSMPLKSGASSPKPEETCKPSPLEQMGWVQQYSCGTLQEKSLKPPTLR